MKLTTNELAVIPSAVAAIAIIGAYFGVKSANNNALKLAREERQARRTYELTELKREAYVRCLEVAYELEIASLQVAIERDGSPTGTPPPETLERWTMAYTAALNSSGQIKLFGPAKVIALMNDLLSLAAEARTTSYQASDTQPAPFNVVQAQLIGAMVAHLDGKEITQEVLDAAVSVATAGLGPQPQSVPPNPPQTSGADATVAGTG